MAHALYRRGDQLVSLYIVPRDVPNEGVQEIMGERTAIWTQADRTYAVVGAGSQAELDALPRSPASRPAEARRSSPTCRAVVVMESDARNRTRREEWMSARRWTLAAAGAVGLGLAAATAS